MSPLYKLRDITRRLRPYIVEQTPTPSYRLSQPIGPLIQDKSILLSEIFNEFGVQFRLTKNEWEKITERGLALKIIKEQRKRNGTF